MVPRPAPQWDSVDTASDEGQLVARIVAGDERAFKNLFDAFYRPLCAYVYGYVRSHAVAEELVQELLGNLWKQRAQVEIRTSLSTYLFGAARNRAYNANRDREMAVRLRARVAREGLGYMTGHGAPPADSRVEQQDLVRALERAMAKLPDRQRQAFYLRWRSHLSYAEIAAVMGVTVKTVENTLSQAFKLLRADLRAFL